MNKIKRVVKSLKQLFPHDCFRAYELSDKIVYLTMYREWFGKKYNFKDCITTHSPYSLYSTSDEEINQAISLFEQRKVGFKNISLK